MFCTQDIKIGFFSKQGTIPLAGGASFFFATGTGIFSSGTGFFGTSGT